MGWAKGRLAQARFLTDFQRRHSLHWLGTNAFSAENRLNISRSVQDAHVFHRPLLGAVDDEVTAHTPEAKRLARKIAAEMADAWCSGQFAQGLEDFIADAICGLQVLKINRLITPNLFHVKTSFGGDEEIAHRLVLRTSALFRLISA
jgi:hypothetical protein